MAANSISSAFRSFWHAMTSYDRHSEFDSPYRTGRHVPLNSGRLGPLTSIATASESRADVTSPYTDDNGRGNNGFDTTAYGGAGASPVTPYSPGMRSASARRASVQEGVEAQGSTEMQSFQDGLAPPPPVSHTWSRIDRWAEENYPELFDQLCEGCTVNDLNETEHQLDCSLPQDVRDSLQVHDGQERGGNPTGIVFGSMLLDCEEIVQEWDNWRKVNQQYLLDTAVINPAVPSKALGGSSSGSSSSAVASSSKAGPSSPRSPNNPAWRQDLMSRQESVPPGAVQRAYAHPLWIPLVRDWGGNNVAVDLAPGPAGKWGQIILFGRDYDTKYVVARSWSAFLALVSDDLNSGKWFVDEETNELKLREFKRSRVEPSYFEILRWRMDQKYGGGARAAKRKSVVPGGGAGSGSPTGSAGGSPYTSPTEPNGDVRGRSMQRLNGKSPIGSPIRPGYGKPSSLARVTEEAAGPSSQENASPMHMPAPAAVPTLAPTPGPAPSLLNGAQPVLKPTEKLVEVESPRLESSKPQLAPLTTVTNGNAATAAATTDEVAAPDSKGKAALADTTNSQAPTAPKTNGKEPVADDGMKTIEI